MACRNQRDWAFLVPEVIDIILEKTADSFSVFVSFISVCQRWRFVALEEEKEKKKSDNVKKLEILRTCRNQLPLLVVETGAWSPSFNRWFFTLPSDGNGYQLKQHLDRPGPCTYRGSSFGWLIGLQRRLRPCLAVEVDIVLFNPFSCAVKRILLSDAYESLGDYGKGVLSSDPSIEGRNYELLIIHQGNSRLICYRSCTNSLMRIQVEDKHGRVVDAAFYGGKIYAITFLGNLLQVDFDTAETKVVVDWNQTCYQYVSETTHIVVSNEGHDLLLVKQQNIKHFEVFKLCCCEEEAERWTWVEINNLGNQALFVGCNFRGSSTFSACVSTVEFPQCRPNCIYYTCGSRWLGNEQRGVFNLELKQHFESPYTVSGDLDLTRLSTQIWMVPNLKGT